MASNFLSKISQRAPMLLLVANNTRKKCVGSLLIRKITTSETGAVLERPQQVRFGLIKVALTVTPFLLCGATISREFAAWLEEHELFVPDDDDDDD
ncbi:chromosome 22 open reading frame 32 [Plakobranchus ocellatus]|uniref:Essential MCU regulator, mitochondrial n=1 Tax=Plakobranchus ocellatus TaxID=259542 RepID=A0AAV3Y6Z9_9GAST|nr:chromosome 22 open reading frame 32 [Plakobranchus ocellatus]